MAKTYLMKEGSIHEKFFASRAKVQFFGGGFGNGKTSCAIVKALQLSKDYPGMNVLAARSTYPKLNDTLRKTFIDFCPSEWIASFPMSKNSENACTLQNGTRFNFRYIAQKKSTEDGQGTSNLLSATYDLAIIDQIEDPEITYKDFLDVLGRMRGDTIYRGDDNTMPRTGPRWIFLTANPTRNWVWSKLIAPLKKYEESGIIVDDLLCERDSETGNPILIDGKPIMLIELVEGSTYENEHVLSKDFIKTLESSYKGQMKDRFLKGEWVAYEGLVYPDYLSSIHTIRHDQLEQYRKDCIKQGVRLSWIEGYDFGLASPSCYLAGFIDDYSNIFILDGFHQKEMPIEAQASEILRIRNKYGIDNSFIYADPDIFRRKGISNATVGKSIAELFSDITPSLIFTRGNNDIMNGIVKVSSYLRSYKYHNHPITYTPNSPYLYFSSNLSFIEEEISSYYWATDKHADRVDKPIDRNDHALDTIKYMLSHKPNAGILKSTQKTLPPHLTVWQEIERTERSNPHRY